MLAMRSSLYHYIRRQKIRIYKTLKGNEPSVGNSLKIRGEDVFLVSYPRSGNTWVRFVLGSLIHDVDVDFDNMEKYFPDIYRNTYSQLESIGNPRYLKSHESYDKRYPKVIYIVRDPRDVAISYYYWMLKFNKFKGDIDGFLDIFFNPKGIAYGSWDKHVEGWITKSYVTTHGFLLLKYEDLLVDAFNNFKKILIFLDIDVDDNKIKQVVRNNDFSGMKNKEVNTSDNNSLFKSTSKAIPFIREGKKQQWRTMFDTNQNKRFIREFEVTMKKTGYLV